MTDVKISELPSASSVNVAAYVPVSSGEFTEKFTVEDIGSINVKQSVRLATTANIGSLFATLNVDGITVEDGDRVLVKDQTFAEQNGIYIVSSTGSWTRTTDFDSNSKIKKGLIVYVLEGDQNRLTAWTLTTSDINLDNLPLVFNQIGSSNLAILENFIRTNNSGENLFIAGRGTGSVYVENVIITTRTISTEAGNDLSILTNSGSLSINPRSENGITIGNVQINGDKISSAQNTSGNIFLSPSGFVFLGNLQVQGNNINASSGNLNLLGSININDTIGSSSGNLQISSNINLANNHKIISSPDFLTINGSNIILESESIPLFKFTTSNLLFPIATINSFYSIDQKTSVKAATTSNIALAGTQSIDGTNVNLLDRVLVKNQTDGIQNGIYNVQENNWTRSIDADAFSEFRTQMTVFVQEGDTQKNTGWLLSNPTSRLTGNTIIDSSYDFVKFADPTTIGSTNQSNGGVEILSVTSDITITDGSKKFQICDLQTDSYSMFLTTQSITESKEIVIKSSQSSIYQLDIYEGIDTNGTYLKTIFSTQSAWFVFDGTNWQSLTPI